MQKSIFIIFFLIFSSCGIVSTLKGYKNSRQANYINFLTESEKATLDSGDEVVKDFNGYTKQKVLTETGTLHIVKQGKIYQFTEINSWIKSSEKINDFGKKTGLITVETEYDDRGNILSQSEFFQKNKAIKKLTGEWKSQIEELDGDSVLVQYLKIFNDYDKPSHTFAIVSPNYKEIKSDYLKPKFRYGDYIEYDVNGKAVKKTPYLYKDKIRVR